MSTFKILQNRVLDACLRGGSGNRDQIKEDINEAIKQVDALLRPDTSVATVPLTAGQQDYSVLTDFGITAISAIRDIVYLSVSDPGVSQPLEPASPEYIRELRRTFTYSTYVALWAFEGLDTLMIYPATQSVGDQMTIYYVVRPADLVLDSDVPTGLPPEWHEIYELAAVQRSMRQTSPEYAMQYGMLYDKKLGDYRKWRNRRDGAVARRAVVGRPGRRLVPHDNSADWRY